MWVKCVSESKGGKKTGKKVVCLLLIKALIEKLNNNTLIRIIGSLVESLLTFKRFTR